MTRTTWARIVVLLAVIGITAGLWLLAQHYDSPATQPGTVQDYSEF